ncbi:MAG: hypothetical protein K0Q73_7036 [Paenibacillus sp.]|jgi:hypothetical protein|nr:hypothetical protein [Paenibacillus sp.]
MLSIVQSSITRENLRKRHYLPDKITVLSQSPLEGEDRKRYYRSAVELLNKIHDNQGDEING